LWNLEIRGELWTSILQFQLSVPRKRREEYHDTPIQSAAEL
jgi:hypothetical protein